MRSGVTFVFLPLTLTPPPTSTPHLPTTRLRWWKMKERTNCSSSSSSRNVACDAEEMRAVCADWMDTRRRATYTAGFLFLFFLFVFVFATLFTDVFSQTAPQRGRGDPLTTSHGQRCGLCRDAVTVLQKKQKCVVRVCEFVDRVSQIRVLGYLSRFLFVCFFFLFFFRCCFVFFPFVFLFSFLLFFFFFFSFLLSPCFFFFLNYFILRCPFYGLNQQVCAPLPCWSTCWTHCGCVGRHQKRTVHLAAWVPTRVRFLDTNTSVRLSRISVFMQWWNVNAVLDTTGTFVFANSHVCIDSFYCLLLFAVHF